mmetsp:Transcript_28786/g.76196  ORF Transcript_28786/g.76196 Transcript_28786/m.76196 type:complete len:253 (+) Transcript_28786:269-1027(+)
MFACSWVGPCFASTAHSLSRRTGAASSLSCTAPTGLPSVVVGAAKPIKVREGECIVLRTPLMVPVVVRRSVVTKRGAVERQQPADVADCEGGHTRQAQVVDLHARVLHIRLEQGVVHVENEAVAWHERAAGAEDEELLSEGVALEGDVVGGEAHRLLHPVMQLVEPRVEPLVAVEGAVRAEEVGVPEERERQERAEKGAPAGRRRSQREDSIDEVREKNRRLASGHVGRADESATVRWLRRLARLQLAVRWL